MLPTIAVDARVVNVGAKESNPENRVGNLQATRKNPHVIDAGSKQDLLASYWYIMWMGISTTLH
jgi:hypothetical protein